MIIKVCGITNLEDALRSIECGANALGFNFYPRSPRFIDPDRAERIIDKLPEHVLSVGVFVVNALFSIAEGRWSTVQLHGLSSESEIPMTDKRLLVATSPSDVARFPNYEIIIDTSWGTGKKAQWDTLRDVGRPFILSGGLTPANVAEAVALLDPAGVDVCSGVEMSPRKKDPLKLRAFVDAAVGTHGRAHEPQKGRWP